jgi:hypothetical protein
LFCFDELRFLFQSLLSPCPSMGYEGIAIAGMAILTPRTAQRNLSKQAISPSGRPEMK